MKLTTIVAGTVAAAGANPQTETGLLRKHNVTLTFPLRAMKPRRFLDHCCIIPCFHRLLGSVNFA